MSCKGLSSDNCIDLPCPLSVQVIDTNDILSQVRDAKKKLDGHCIRIEGCNERYTPLQFAAQNGFKDLAKALLDANANPNFSGNDTMNKQAKKKIGSTKVNKNDQQNPDEYFNCEKYPLLLAAEKGHYEILRLFKYYNNSKSVSAAPKTEDEAKTEDTKLFNIPRLHVNFNVISRERNETVLHIVLRQPLLDETNIKDSARITWQGKSPNRLYYPRFWSDSTEAAYKATTLRDISDSYGNCIKVLLDMDEFKHKRISHENQYPKQMQQIVNHKDNHKNTALHYAVSNWSGKVVEKLLSLGANPSIKNKNGEIPLSRISKSTFENFLDKRCIIIKDFDPSDNEMEEDGGKDDSPSNISQDYDQSFMMKINRYGKDKDNEMSFNYAFLAPRKTNKTVDDYKNTYAETPSRINKPEMKVVWEMSQSSEHRSLITHPVIDSFLWIKWKLMTRFHNRLLRIRFLFLYCVLWITFAQFGGHNWMSINLSGNENDHEESNRTFCDDLPHEFKIDDFSVWNEDSFMWSSLWYYCFFIVFAAQCILIRRDFVTTSDKKFLDGHRVSTWVDFLNVILSVAILICGKTILWFVLSILLIFYIIMEVTEMLAVPLKYLTESSNYFDLSMIVMTYIVLYIPKKEISNPHVFSIFDENRQENDNTCGVKRGISALILVIVCSRYLVSLAKSPGFKDYNLYMIMFCKVARTYGKIMVWFASYIISFGLGFYIMFHDDTKLFATQRNTRQPLINQTSNETTSSCDCGKTTRERSRFDNPFLSLVKTWTMFVGEFDFDDLPITGGDVSVTMAYVFLLTFIFLIVIVIMNLLNGLAVSDTQRMITDSKIESQVSFIETIRYFESVYLDAGKLPFFMEKYMDKDGFGFNKLFRNHIMPTKLFIFSSKYTDDFRLTLPLEETETTSDRVFKTLSRLCNKKEIKSSFLFKLKNWFSREKSNYGSEEFLDKARTILIRLKRAKVRDRKQQELTVEIEQLKGERKKFERLKNETLKDQIKNMENMLQHLVANSSND